MPASVLGGGKQLRSSYGSCGVEWIALELVVMCAWNRSMVNSQSKQKTYSFWSVDVKYMNKNVLLTGFDTISIQMEFSKPKSMVHLQKHSM